MEEKRQAQLMVLEERLGYRFQDQQLLNTALTHTSYVKGDGRGAVHNERLEFLGDAVLELCASEYIYEAYPKLGEGRMTRVRAMAVCEQALFEAARAIGLGAMIRLGHGEENTGGRNKPSIVSDALEAVIGAIYLDGGLKPAKAFVLGFAKATIEAAVGGRERDYKSQLQEYVQQKHMGAVEYRLAAATGPDHRKEFHMQVRLCNETIGTGIGASKLEAGQRAAQAALLFIKTQHET